MTDPSEGINDEKLLARIRSTPWIAELLVLFDFDIARVADGPVEEVRLETGEPLEMVAGDGTGGAFMLVGSGPTRPVVYVGSEGEGGLIATNFADALALVVGLSNIHDATAMPIGADGGAALRAWLAKTDDELREYWPTLDEDRVRAREVLGLREADGPLLEALHAAAADERYRPISEYGPYESMLR
ncbi:hypothetical protein GCM10009682_55970 [Luedemannella flava]|uniref:SUKH-4 immunity protein of toxin-antitoxin system n=1 Tax=Luedemannella flava TaxID=349316 RepID=A0ABP4YSX5_9ACTN